ncbi:hypothetical protein EIL87_25145 [Saccharopolyspora rhizosphaerae]|uniref:Uncharacterized protein n=1 Tax=Saccharopolyspora rhizosphaerae TaxID=2492662 RepID=A0A3R8QI01_9PSEU|nr:hypothetical protein [Saccharopolyspora rhizosphaerae]RRO12954.1 hypothetical protein EIL87_25145 [Saccharopolyspora rhizosphaerae]
MRPRQVGRRAVLVIVAVLAAVVPGAAAAQAGGQSPRPDTHCRYHSSTGETRCFSTLAEATAQPRDARGDVIQATLFTDPDYGGSSFTVYGSEMCEKDGVVNFQINLPDDWKDVVSSVQPWGGCWIWLYPEPDLGGERDGPFKENTPDVGSMMNDRTQSVGLS